MWENATHITSEEYLVLLHTHYHFLLLLDQLLPIHQVIQLGQMALEELYKSLESLHFSLELILRVAVQEGHLLGIEQLGQLLLLEGGHCDLLVMEDPLEGDY